MGTKSKALERCNPKKTEHFSAASRLETKLTEGLPSVTRSACMILLVLELEYTREEHGSASRDIAGPTEGNFCTCEHICSVENMVMTSVRQNTDAQRLSPTIPVMTQKSHSSLTGISQQISQESHKQSANLTNLTTNLTRNLTNLIRNLTTFLVQNP